MFFLPLANIRDQFPHLVYTNKNYKFVYIFFKFLRDEEAILSELIPKFGLLLIS
jgi:hypothetical protein